MNLLSVAAGGLSPMELKTDDCVTLQLGLQWSAVADNPIEMAEKAIVSDIKYAMTQRKMFCVHNYNFENHFCMSKLSNLKTIRERLRRMSIRFLSVPNATYQDGQLKVTEGCVAWIATPMQYALCDLDRDVTKALKVFTNSVINHSRPLNHRDDASSSSSSFHSDEDMDEIQQQTYGFPPA